MHKSSRSSNSQKDISKNIDNTNKNINNIKEQLAKLELDPLESVYFNHSISPLLSILVQLATTSFDLPSSTNFLSTSAVACAKHSKIKDTIHLIYDINEDCEDIYKIVKRRIDFLLEHAKNC